MRPRLKQYGDLTASDFEAEPVWVSCHGIDENEPWYEETDEETFRPWTAEVPVSPSDGMFLVSATFHLADGSTRKGFVTPTFEGTEFPRALGQLQPQLFAPAGERVGFWLGMFPSREARDAAYRALGRAPTQLFPIQFRADDGLSTGVCAGEIRGFCSIPKGLSAPVQIET
jgi:hypothetical protein